MIENGKVLLIVCFAVFCPNPGLAQDAKKGSDSTWDSDIRTFGTLATMSYQNGKQVLGKYGPELEKKIAVAKITNARMQAILPAIGTIARDIDFQERVYMGVANPKPLTPDEIAERTKSFGNAFAAGLGDEDAKDQVIGDIVKQLAELNVNQRGAEQAIYQLRAQQVKLWERLIPELRSNSGSETKAPCLKLEHIMTTTGLVNVVRDQSMALCNVSDSALTDVVIRIRTNLSTSPKGTDEKFFFIPNFSRRSRIELPGNMYGKIVPTLELHIQRFVPGKSRSRIPVNDMPALVSAPIMGTPMIVSIWSKELQREDIEIRMDPKPTVDSKTVRVQGPLSQVETTITHHFAE